MDAIFNLAGVTSFLAAEVGLTLFDRSLLLTDTYKFPYPAVVTFVQLLVTAGLGALINFLLGLTLPAWLFNSYEPLSNGDEDYSADEYPPWQKDSQPSRRSTTDRSDLDSAAKHAFYSDGESSPPSLLLRLRSRLNSACEARFGRSSSSVFVFLAFALAFRLALGNILLSYVSFPTYTIILTLALPWSLALTNHGESGSAILLAFASALALVFAAIPLARLPGLVDGFLGVTLSCLDVLLAILAVRVSRQQGSGSHHSLQGSPARSRWASLANTLLSYVPIFRNAVRIVSKASLLAAAVLFPLLPLSGEAQDISRNCYVLSDPPFWHRMIAGIALQATGLLFYFLIASRGAPFIMTFLQVPLCSVVMAVLYHKKLSPQGWINLSLCWVFCLVRARQRGDESTPSNAKSNRNFCAFLRKLFLAIVLYGAIYQGSYTLEEYLAAGTISLPTFGVLGWKHHAEKNVTAVELPEHSNNIRDDYLGPRPAPETFADMKQIMSNCADSVTGTGVEDIVHCLAYLNSSEKEYLVSPPADKAQPKGNKSRLRFQQNSGKSPVTAKATCTGKETLFHTYWTGPATWRFELFIKAYLYSQNLSCSRLWIWLDTDIDADAVDKMLFHDALFQRFHFLLDEKYIVLKKWTIPERIPFPDVAGESAAADNVVRTASGELYLVPDQLYKTVSNPTQVSDLVRFVVLHLHGGVYLDLDVLLLRDLRPLLLPNPAAAASEDQSQQPAWAEQWVERSDNPGDYNTAVLSLPANSSLSSYLLSGGVRMGMNFHPKIIGRMLWKEGRNGELAMLHNAFFDPLVTNLRRKGTKVCTVPCHKNFESSFMRVVDEPDNEWSNYRGELVASQSSGVGDNAAATSTRPVAGNGVDTRGTNNRTMENFFRGAFAYHIHNQWKKFPEQGSWMDVITQAQDGFFAGKRTNVYGETWGGPPLEGYDRAEWGWKKL